jgi:hypothetical protein
MGTSVRQPVIHSSKYLQSVHNTVHKHGAGLRSLERTTQRRSYSGK